MSSKLSSVAVSVELPSITTETSDSTTAPKKKTRLVHCSDGVLEVTDESELESDTDSETESDAEDVSPPSSNVSNLGGFVPSALHESARGVSAPSSPNVSTPSVFTSSAPDVSSLGGFAPSAQDIGTASSLSTRGRPATSLPKSRIRTSERSRRWSTYPERTSCQPEWLAKTNPHALRWKSWFWYYTVFGACKSFDAANWAGEKLAWFFGITTPKYADAIAEYERQRASAREERRAERRQYREHMRELESDRAAIAARENRTHSSKAENSTQLHSMPTVLGEEDNSTFALDGHH